jgi:YVTN family beta-propeller protein
MTKGLMLALLTTIVALFAACSQPAGDDQDRPHAAAPTVMPESGFVYTADERDNSITVIDLSTGQVKSIATSISPHNVQVSLDGRLLLAVGAIEKDNAQGGRGHGEMGGAERGRLLILDTGGLSVEGATEIEVGRAPAHVVVDGQTKWAYVTNAMDNNLSVVDLQQHKVIATIPTGAMPHGLRLSPGGRELYVANVSDNSVSVIDVTRSKEMTRIPVGKAPAQVGFTSDGRRVYVSLRDENSVAVIDVAQRKKIATVAVGRNPIQVFATPDGRYVYVANQGTEANPDNTVSVIETGHNSVIATIETGKGAHGVVVSDDGRHAFISNIADGTVSVIDTANRQVINTIKVGEGPNGIAFKGARR